MKVAIGNDHAGYDYKLALSTLMKEWGHEVLDLGSHSADSVDYPDIASLVGDMLVKGEVDRGVLICGTGIGMSIAANKIEGIRCAMCSESYSARLTRLHNDANVVSMGARTIGIEIAADILKTFLDTDFPAEERNVRRIQKAMDLQK